MIRRVFVTGGAHGIGKSIVEAFAGRGNKVAFCDIDVAPGWIHVRKDEVLRPEDHELHLSGRVGKPEDIARMCLSLCEPENDFINGQTQTINGGATVKMIYPE